MAGISSINSSNMDSSSTIKAYSNKGLSGLVSGMDTESIVEGLLAGTQAKIDSTKQKMQQLIWKQEIYRDIISQLKDFQLKYFSFTNEKSNLLSVSFYSTMSAVSSSQKVTTLASSRANAGEMTINSVKQLATRSRVSAQSSALAQLKGVYSHESLSSLFEDRILRISVGDVSKDIVVRGTTVDSILSSLNAQFEEEFADAGVTATVEDGVLKITAGDPEATVTIHSDSSPAALAILGFSGETTGAGEVTGEIDETQAGTKLTITLDGIQKSIDLNTEAADAEEFVASLQEAVTRAFGSSVKVELTEDGGQQLISFKTMKQNYGPDGVPVGEPVEDPTRQIILTGSNAVMNIFGMKNGQSNKISTGMNIGDINFARPLTGTETDEEGVYAYEFTINGVDFRFTSKDTLSSVISRINTSDAGVTVTYSSLTDRFEMTAKDYGAGFAIDMMDRSGSNFLEALFGTDHTFTEGVNAIIEVNGIEIQRSSNTFTVDGVTITVSETSDTPVKINVSRDTEQIEKGIADFVNDYNALIEKLNELIRTKATYRDYPPLTAAQKAEMTEKEIELWEEKAREGLLRNDPTIYKLLQDMRSALYSRVSGSRYALYDLGIETSGIYGDYGKLVIKDPSVLAKAIESDPESVRQLFTDAADGIATRINDILNKSVKVSYSSPGSLVSLAGTVDMADEKSTIGREIKWLEERLEVLEDRYLAEKERYWKQFNEMEKLISLMNQQSMWLASQFTWN
jgi:flagellar hook-associated protein 2